MSLTISLRSEILKTKNTAAFYFTLIGAALVPLLILLNVAANGLPDRGIRNDDAINIVFDMLSQMNGICILPLFVVLICTLLPQIEYKNNSWKQVLASPQTKANIYLSKFLNIHLLIVLFLVASHLIMWVVIVAVHFILPALSVLHQSFDGYKAITDNLHSYTCVLAICSIQFWIGLRSNNFIAPVAIGVVSWLIGAIMVFEYNSPMSVYFPYSFPSIRFSKLFVSRLAQVEWSSWGCAVVVLLLGFLDFRGRRMVK